LAKPLYEATKGGEWEPLVWRREQEKAFKEIKKALTNAPALGLLVVMKSFFLYVHGQKVTVIVVLTRLLALSGGLLVKTTRCLCTLAVTTALVTEADKLTLWQELTVWVPHYVLTFMECNGNY
jgi:hypothetical protein